MATENIPSRLHCVAEGNVLTGANEIFDDGKNKKQNVINQENDQRLETLETAVGTGGSVDSRIESAKTEIVGGASSDCNTLGKAEALISTNANDIAALQEAYAALTQNDVVVVAPSDTWPVATPAQNIIYRVVDRTNTPPQYYTDYMWNGTAMVEMAQYNNAIDPRPKKSSQNLVTSGGVFDNMGALDVSELNATENPHTLAKYVDLSAALAAVPTDYQKGGMSIKFIQSSDNKYVQYRLMSNTFNTTPANWQGVDDEPTDGSDNLVKSGGVFQGLNDIDERLKHLPIKENESGNIDFVDALQRIIFRLSSDGANAKQYNICDANGNIVYTLSKDFFDSLLVAAAKGVELSQFIIVDEDGNLYFCDDNNYYPMILYQDGTFDVGKIGNTLKSIIIDLIDQNLEGVKTFVAIGDSITQGAGATGSNAWVTQLGNYLRNNNYIDSYKNFGSGGNTSSGIASYCGAKPLYITADVTIPATVTGVEISIDNSTMRLCDPVGNCEPTSINKPWEVDPCYLGGIAGFITYSVATGKYTFTRQTVGTQIELKAYEQIIPRAAYHCLNADYLTIFVGTNNSVGSDSTKIAALMDDVRRLAKLSKNGRYIIISPYIESNKSEPSQTMISAFREEYGSRHFDLYQYFSTRGVIDAVNEGLLPSGEQSDWKSLLLKSDGVHPNDIGHTLIYERIKERFFQLKYIN